MKQLLAMVVLVVFTVLMKECNSAPSPIILIPGLMGSRLEVKDSKPNSLCSTRNSYKKLWIAPIRLLKYNPATNSFHNNSYVKVTVPDFGGTNGIEYLMTGILRGLSPYFRDMIKYFVDRGYKKGKSIRAAPYDWRLAADELERRGYFHRLKSLVEDTYRRNGNTKVTLVVHSMGGLVSLHFLTGFNGINQAWKNKYIHAYIPLSGAWNGAVLALEAAISGVPLGNSFAFADRFIRMFTAPLARTLESIPWLVPKSSVFGTRVLVSTPSRQYTANDYEDLFGSIGYTNGYKFFQGVQGLVQDYPAPNVPTYCYYGANVSTRKKLIYNKDFRPGAKTIDVTPKYAFGNGDGVVNMESLKVCHRWSSMHPQYHFSYKEYSKVNHDGIVKDKSVLSDIARIVGALAPKKKSWRWKKRS